MVDAGRLERDPLEGPAHRPVNLPDQLARDLVDRGRADLSAAPALKGDLGGLVVEAGDRRVVPAAGSAVRLERVVGLVVVLLGGLLPPGLGGALGPVLGQDGGDVGATAHGRDDLRAVGA